MRGDALNQHAYFSINNISWIRDTGDTRFNPITQSKIDDFATDFSDFLRARQSLLYELGKNYCSKLERMNHRAIVG